MITDAVQAGGYFSDPIDYTTATFAAAGNPAPTAAFQAGYVFAGSHAPVCADNVAQDTLATRFQTQSELRPHPVRRHGHLAEPARPEDLLHPVHGERGCH